MAVTGHQLHDVLGKAGARGCRPQHTHNGGVGAEGAARAAQQDGVAALEADAGGVGGHVGAGLVDDADDPERHADLPQLQPVGERRPAHHLADGVGQAGDLTQSGGHALHPIGVEPQPVDQVSLGAGCLGGGAVLRVGREHIGASLHQGVGHRVQRGVLGRAGRERELRRGHAGALRRSRRSSPRVWGSRGQA